MIERLEISGVHFKIEPKLHDYVVKKIGKLDQYMSRHSKKSAHAEVRLKEVTIKGKKQATCEVVLHLPNEVFDTKETTINMFAAIDIVETKLKTRLKKYKEVHEHPFKLRRRIMARLRRKQSREA